MHGLHSRIIFFIVAIAFCPLVTAETAGVKVLILGDSLSSAYNIPMERGWVTLLQQRVAEKYPGTRIVNASVSGETAANAVHRLPALLEQHEPDVLVIELGGNDGLRGIKLAQVRQSLQSLIETGKTSGAEVVLAGIHLHPNYGAKFNQLFLDMYRELAAQYKVRLVPLILEGVGDDPAKMQEDMTHPKADAEPAVLDNMWPAIEQAIKEAKKKTPLAESAEAQKQQE
ncbi:MAG TPA: arylesterase [Gammaproteobacteria bacterium]|nr:arylesterase [Gammaproteobacteria bacterium]